LKLPQKDLGASFGYKQENELEPFGLPLHLQIGVWSFMRLNKNPIKISTEIKKMEGA